MELVSEFEIEDLGIQELDVYDIEVEDNHNFFGNDILVHNSAYYTIAPIMDKVIHFKPNLTMNEYVDIADKFEMDVVAPVINKSVEVACSKLNAKKQHVKGDKRQNTANSVITITKKKYRARISDSERKRYPETKPHMKFM